MQLQPDRPRLRPPLLARAFRRTRTRAIHAPVAIDPTAKPIITIEKPPAPSCRERWISVGTPAIQQPVVIVIAKDGTLIQKEYRMSPGDAPAAIKTAVTAQYPSGTISHIKEVERKDVKFYELSVKSGAKSHALKLDESGKPVKVD